MRSSFTPAINSLIDLALEEDLGLGDVTSDVLLGRRHHSRGVIEARENLVLSGIELSAEIFYRVDDALEVNKRAGDGDRLEPGGTVMTIHGPACSMLKAERTSLNFLQKLSGIATLTARYVEAAHRGNPDTRVCDTRKTTPGFRLLSKYAVRCGGGHNHRFSLADAVMIKDNHIAAAGSVEAAVRTIRRHAPHTAKVEVEADTLEQVEEALAAGADVILLDNMAAEDIRAAVKKTDRRAILEASGGISLATIDAYAATGVDVISVGAITHSAPAADLALNLELSR